MSLFARQKKDLKRGREEVGRRLAGMGEGESPALGSGEIAADSPTSIHHGRHLLH